MFITYVINTERKAMADEKIELTPTEHAILKLMADGMTSSEIADETFKARRTVDGHKANIYNKLRVRNAMEAVNEARELGLI
jgi:DNA-binding CsgD family transcriptional regulator